MKFSVTTLVVLGQALTALAAPSFFSQYELDSSSNKRSGDSIVDRLRDDKRFSRFVEALEKERGLRNDLERGGEHTIFAPTDDAFKRAEKEWRDANVDKPEMHDILKLHIASEATITQDRLHPGALIPTSLRLKSLNDRHQRIRVFRFADRVWLNMRAAVVGSEIEAKNGVIHAIDNVLTPPTNAVETLDALPSIFSTFSLALERTGVADKIEREKGLTVFAPSNSAWKTLGLDNLKYLFSCVGQENEREEGRGKGGDESRRPSCQGTKDLKRIVEHHVGTDLAYSTDFMDKETYKLSTLGDEKLVIQAKRREGHHEEEDRSDKEKHQDVRRYNFIINNGEARVVLTDALASNAAIQVVDAIVIPKNVKLPHGDRILLEI